MNELTSIVDRLKALKLSGMAEAVSDLIKLPVQMRPSLEMALSKMLETETRYRDDSRTARLLKASKLRYRVLVEDITCSTTRNFTREQLTSIADCSFVRRGENLLITGLTGCGKSYIACALGYQACTLGLKTLYLNMNRFVDALKQSRLDGTFSQMLSRLDKNDLIVLDDFGLQKMDSDTRIALLTLLEERYEKS
jgi:DNA replication protein DnaC